MTSSSSSPPPIVFSHAPGTSSLPFILHWLELPECPSTNDIAYQHARHLPLGEAIVVTTPRQTAGRGRNGRRWHAAPSASVTFSIAAPLPSAVDLCSLPLAAGVVLAETLTEIAPVRLKWPNDLLLFDRKLGGILVESHWRACGSSPQPLIVLGVGLNRFLPPFSPADPPSPCPPLSPAALSEHLPDPPSPSMLIARLVPPLLDLLAHYAAGGTFHPYRSRWWALAAWREIDLLLISDNGDSPIVGRIVGIDADGALLFATTLESSPRRLISAAYHLRPLLSPPPAEEAGANCI
ncbi:MAG: biotin--[acetyl-CoA-carboxylase] ligase [Hydrogenophilus sp.]|nr:biotin--[acetyl-CoA-carboxylase] ligase [Hydrogenophilus sp.]